MTRYKQLVALSFLLLLGFSCQREDDNARGREEDVRSHSSVSAGLIQELQRQFKVEYNPHDASKGRSTDIANREILFEALSPQWEKTKEFRISKEVLASITPLSAEWALTRVADGVEELSQEEFVRLSPRLNRALLLNIKAKEHIAKGMSIALVIPNLEYVKRGGKLSSDDGVVPMGFEGVVYLYDLEGQPKYLYTYEGKGCRNIYQAQKKDESRLGFIVEEVCYWVKVEDDYSELDEGRDKGTLPAIGITKKKICYSLYRYVYSYSLGKDNVSEVSKYFIDGNGNRIYGGSISNPPESPLEARWQATKKEVEAVMGSPVVTQYILAAKNGLMARTSKVFRVEAGFWVYMDYKTGEIYCSPISYGRDTPYLHGSQASIKPSPPMLKKSKGEGVPDSAYPIFFIHTHSSLKLAPDGFVRKVGLSQPDIDWADSWQMPVVALDAVGKMTEEECVIISSGDEFENLKAYIYVPEYK